MAPLREQPSLMTGERCDFSLRIEDIMPKAAKNTKHCAGLWYSHNISGHFSEFIVKPLQNLTPLLPVVDDLQADKTHRKSKQIHVVAEISVNW